MPPLGSGGSPYGCNKGRGYNPRSAEDVFAEFFGSSPFGFASEKQGRSSKRYSGGGKFGTFSGTENMFGTFSESGHKTPKKRPPVENVLKCNLVELYIGLAMKMRISRTVIDANGCLATETEMLRIEVKPGWKKDTTITLPDKGNEQPGQLPADLVFVIDEKKHEVYTRDGDDLILKQKLGLAKAIAGKTLSITTLDGREPKHPCDRYQPQLRGCVHKRRDAHCKGTWEQGRPEDQV